ncbi:chemotaxis protein CheY [Litchfieldella anticariensis FP35 = DSM 16096]|uniref:Transcriptional regulatory protein n=1 Tax=Litchfieldella anticariensis (strain DSM 16096 / CECT 5854 / CIP 108499 / LMG 22089 / FP35) TaxID=1121939 RepID=S2KQN4_LITA3|nr:response regulator [Halomonas anticariensis]EPC02793.1 chemotaxis protein CheY [Halomonas anticariensis FP35 = DSM 16096]
MTDPVRVLIVEDDPMVMRFNLEYLNRLDDVTLAAQCLDVPSALEVLDRQPVDLVLLDVYLRERSGLEVVRWLRRQGRDVDVILITAASEVETVRTAHQLGVRDFLVKPFEFERFRDAVQACVTARRSLERLPERVAQRDLDRLFKPPSGEVPRRPDGLPKGLTAPTLAQVVAAILALDNDGFSTETLVPATGMSRVSLRKYLKFLAQEGLLEESFHYGQVGRPSFSYRCLDREGLAELSE